MSFKTKKLRLTKITIAELNRNRMHIIKGGSVVMGCNQETQDKLNPACNKSANPDNC